MLAAFWAWMSHYPTCIWLSQLIDCINHFVSGPHSSGPYIFSGDSRDGVQAIMSTITVV